MILCNFRLLRVVGVSSLFRLKSVAGPFIVYSPW